MNRKEEYLDERWKERASQIRELDKHKCAMCGASGVVLDVHHLSYPPPPFHIWDAKDYELVTLCKDCHNKIHEAMARPILLPDRTLIYEHKYIECRNSGDRKVNDILYMRLKAKGYKGLPYTQQIIDWLCDEHWIEAIGIVRPLFELYDDGRARDRAYGFKYEARVYEIRGDCGHCVTQDLFDNRGDAELAAIEHAVEYLI